MKLEHILEGRLVWIFKTKGVTYLATGAFMVPCPFHVSGLDDGQKLTLYGAGYSVLDNVKLATVKSEASGEAAVTFSYKNKADYIFNDAYIDVLRESVTGADWADAATKDGGRYIAFAERWLARASTQKVLKQFKVKSTTVEMALVDGVMMYRCGGVVVF